MKKTALFTALLCLTPASLFADVPLFINYQGKVYDSSGLPLGASGSASAPVAAPVNRKVLFRFYDAVTGGNRLWTEEQTVTISVGEFSVLLGQGIAATGTAVGESRPAIDTVFTSGTPSRFLEITVDNGDNSITEADVPITPRQQITTTAFSFRARTADSIAGSSDLAITPLAGTASNYGLGWYGTGRLFGGVAIDGPVLYGNAGGALGSNTNGTYNTALRWNAAGQVGVGTATLAGAAASSKLVLQGDDGATPAQQLVIRGESDTTKRLNIGFNTTANQATLQSYTAASTVGNLLLNSSGGNVGIGTGGAAPNAKLTIGSPMGHPNTTSLSFSTNAGALGQTAGSELILGNFGSTTGDLDTFAISSYRATTGSDWTNASLVLGRNINDTKRPNGAFMSINSSGNFGIGSLTPRAKLDVNGTVRANVLHVESGVQVATATSSNAVARFGSADVHTHFGSFDGGSSYATWMQAMRPDGMNFPMAINPNGGNVGIGTSNPQHKLDVNGDISLIGAIRMKNHQFIHGQNTSGVSEAAFWPRSGDGTYLNYGAAGFFIRNNSSTTTMTMQNDGKVKIGTARGEGLLNVGAVAAALAWNGYLNTDGGNSGNGSGVQSVSIACDGTVYASTFFVTSDRRIKTKLSPTDSVKDLTTLMGIEVTDYQLKDTVSNGSAPQKKVIAQQVEEVYPQAVSSKKGVVPDIYQKAGVKEGWVELATNLKVGERVRLISSSGDSVEDVLEVRGDSFRTSLKTPIDQLFVYGREVADFRTVDYDAITMLNVSATQEIKREKDAEIRALQQENSALRAKLAVQQDSTVSLEARLIAIEQRLSGESPAPQTVSLRTANAAK